MLPDYPLLKKHLTTALILAAVIALYWYSRSLQDIFLNLTGTLKQYEVGHSFLSQSVFVILGAVSAMLSPFSSAPLIPFAVVLWGEKLTTALLFLGWMIGGTFTYLLGKKVGYSIIKNYTDIDGAIAHYHQNIRPGTEFLIVLLFRFAMPAEVPGYVLGTVRYDFWKYLLATGIAELPFAILTVYAGGAVLEKDIFMLAGSILLIIGILGSAFYLFRRKLNSETPDGR